MKKLRVGRVVFRVLLSGILVLAVASTAASARGDQSSRDVQSVAAEFTSLDAALSARGLHLDVGPNGVRMAELVLMGFNELVHRSDVIVVATVEGLGPAQWNSVNGEPYKESSDDHPYLPAQYRLVDIAVESSLKGSESGESLEFVTWWSPSDSGSIVYGGLSPGPTLLGRMDGEFVVGSRVLLFLRETSVALYPGGEFKALGLTNSYQAYFEQTEVGGARSLEPLRSVDSWDALVAATRAEIDSPIEPASSVRNQLSVVSPFGDVKGGALDNADVRLVIVGGQVTCVGSGCGPDVESRPVSPATGGASP